MMVVKKITMRDVFLVQQFSNTTSFAKLAFDYIKSVFPLVSNSVFSPDRSKIVSLAWLKMNHMWCHIIFPQPILCFCLSLVIKIKSQGYNSNCKSDRNIDIGFKTHFQVLTVTYVWF